MKCNCKKVERILENLFSSKCKTSFWEKKFFLRIPGMGKFERKYGTTKFTGMMKKKCERKKTQTF